MIEITFLLIFSILAFIIAGLCLFATIIMCTGGWCKECWCSIFSCMVFAGIGAGSLCGRNATVKKYNSEYTKHLTDIISLHRGDGIEGSFILGSGHVQDVQYYFYYYETPKGIKLGKIEAEDSYIVETNSITPSIYEVKESGTVDVYYNIYVPVGTVVASYTLN